VSLLSYFRFTTRVFH